MEPGATRTTGFCCPADDATRVTRPCAGLPYRVELTIVHSGYDSRPVVPGSGRTTDRLPRHVVRWIGASGTIGGDRARDQITWKSRPGTDDGPSYH
jgi:hypothetical protein